jgi:hypothetical protein
MIPVNDNAGGMNPDPAARVKKIILTTVLAEKTSAVLSS